MRLMSRTRRFGAAAVLAVAALGAPTAYAGDDSAAQVEATLRRIQQAEDPAAAFDALDRRTRTAVVEYLTPVNVQVQNYCEITVARGADPQDEACYAATMYADYGKDPSAGGNAGPTTAAGLGDGSVSATQCGGREAAIVVRNKLNRRLFAFAVRFYACANGSSIVVDAYRTFTPTVYVPFWFDKGNTEADQFGGVGHAYYHTHTVRKFELCITGKLGCIYQANITADTAIYGTGAWRWEIGG